MIWLQGGPGSASIKDALALNGPYWMNMDGKLEKFEYSWTQFADMLFVDNPLGTGYSTANQKSDYVKNETWVANDFWAFML